MLEMHDDSGAPPATNDDNDVTAALSKLSLGDDKTQVVTAMSPDVTRASLTLLALTLAQGNNCDEHRLSAKIVDLLNANSADDKAGGVQLSTDPTEFAVGLSALDREGVLLESANGVAKSFVGRVISLARISLGLVLGEYVFRSEGV